MKCNFCGNNVSDGSELCPSCGMILSLGEEADSEIRIPEYTPNVFGSEPIKVPEPPVEPEEEVIPASEPEVYEAPAYDEAPAEAVEEPEAYGAPAYDEAPAEAVEEPEVYEAPAYDEVPAEAVAESEVYEAPAYEGDVPDADSEEDVSYPEYEAFVEDVGEQAIVEDIVTEEADEDAYTPVIVPVEEPIQEVEDISSQTDDEYEEIETVQDGDDDTYVKSGKKGPLATIAALCVLLVCLVVAGGYIVNKMLPERATTKPSVNAVVNTTEAGTTEDGAYEETTADETQPNEDETTAADDETTSEETTDAETTTETTTEAQNVTNQSTTQQTTVRQTTTKQTTTRQTTTRQTTTRKPTTKPATTKPTTTDPYGINSVTVQKPKTYLSSTYHAYVTVRSVKMRSTPSSSSERVQYLEKGSEVIVYAKQSGFSYVWSTRFGTYGWISDSYLSKSRPVESTTAVTKNTVSPDVNGSGETMYTTNTLNLRKGPSTSHDVIKTVPINYPVKIVGYKSGVSGWAYVTDLTTGTNGWVSTAYLK